MLDKPGGRLAGKSTLNRLEHADKIGQDRHHKFDHDGAAIERLFVDVFLDAFSEPPIRIEIEIDLDATDDPLYGQQEGRHLAGMMTVETIGKIPGRILSSAKASEGLRGGCGFRGKSCARR